MAELILQTIQEKKMTQRSWLMNYMQMMRMTRPRKKVKQKRLKPVVMEITLRNKETFYRH